MVDTNLGTVPLEPELGGSYKGAADERVTLLALVKLLLDADRLQIIGMVAQSPCTQDDLMQQLPIKRAAMARHLQQLCDAELVSVSQVQTNAVYRLNVKRIQDLKRALFARTEDMTVQSAEEKVLSAFVKEGRLTDMPVQLSKRMIVLGWLAGDFAANVDYPEHVVNEILQRHFDDYATLRRYLVDFGFMQRQSGIYRKIVN